jgi:hypothetical protein
MTQTRSDGPQQDLAAGAVGDAASSVVDDVGEAVGEGRAGQAGGRIVHQWQAS